MSTHNEPYRYYAFISCNSMDLSIAKRLQRKIEWYHLPTTIRKEIKKDRNEELPKRLNPVFLYTKNLPLGSLDDLLLQELKKSKYLIVICSPRAAQSKWVNREVENFILMGRFDRIIPYIVDGEGNSKDPENEAFPLILRRERTFLSYSNLTPEENAERHAGLREKLANVDERNGVSIHQEGERVARLKIVAKMLEIHPDNLNDDDKRRRKQIFFSVASIVTILLFLCLSVYDKYYRIHVSYFADYVERWGVPEGIFPLTDEQVSKRQYHYCIKRQGQKWIRVIHANSSGQPVPVENTERLGRPMNTKYTFSAERDAESNRLILNTISYQDRMNNEIQCVAVSPDQTFFDYTKSRKRSDDTYLKAEMTSVLPRILNKSNITLFRVEYDENGFVHKEFFHFSKKERTVDAEGIGGFEYKRNEKGQVLEKYYLDIHGKHTQSRVGVSKRTYEYDKNGNYYLGKYFNLKGNLVPNELGWSIVKNYYDNDGNCFRLEYLDEHDNFAPQKEGICGWEAEYKGGQRILMKFFGKDGKPCLHRGGFAETEFIYNTNGDMSECRFLGLNHELVMTRDGYAKMTVEYDAYGNKCEVRFFNTEGNRCYNIEGYSGIKSCYDKYGAEEKRFYLDKDDTYCNTKEGYAGWISKFEDPNGNETERQFVDIQGRSCLTNKCFALWKSEYDDSGKEKSRTFYDDSTKPKRTLTIDKFSQWDSEYDKKGNEEKRIFLDLNGKICDSAFGYAICKVTYDKKGNPESRTFYNKANELIYELQYQEQYLALNGYSLTKEKSVDGYEKPAFPIYDMNLMAAMAPGDEVTGCVDQYNDAGYLTKRYYVDDNNNLTWGPEGFSEKIIKYNASNKETEIVLLDSDKKEIKKSTFEYDQYDRLTRKIETSEYTFNGEITHDIAIETRSYDSSGNLVTIEQRDDKGNPKSIYVENEYRDCRYYKVTYQYNDSNQMISKEEYVNPNDVYSESPDVKWLKTVYTYDTNGNLISESFYGTQGKLFDREDYRGKYASKRMKYDPVGNILECAYYDQEDKLCNVSEGFAIIRSEYDRWGNETVRQFFDSDEKPCTNENKIHKVIVRYDHMGRKIEGETFDTENNPTGIYYEMSPEDHSGYTRWEKEYYPDGTRKKEVTYWDTTPTPFGFAKKITCYTPKNRISSIEYFSADGTPFFLPEEGYAKVAMKYNTTWMDPVCSEVAYFGVDGKPCVNKDGNAGWKTKYDEQGNVIETVFFDINGKPIE